MSTIAVEALTKRYRAVTAVDDLTFQLAPGRVTGFLGPNGAGKSTTIRVLLGLARPTSGRATINGRRYAELHDPLRQVGALLDPNVFHPGRSGALAAALLGDPQILVLDEPAGGLDPEGVAWLRGLLRRLADEARTVFVSSHQLAELAQIADDVVIINQGRLIAAGPMAGLLERSKASSLEDLFLAATSPDAPTGHPASTRPRSLS